MDLTRFSRMFSVLGFRPHHPHSYSTHRASTETLHFPIELYLSIFDYFISPLPIQAEYRDVLTNLCLVCRVFCRMIQPHIFRALKFSNKKGNKLISTDGPQAFCTGVINRVAAATLLAQHVTECTLRDWSITSTFRTGSGSPTRLWEVYRHTLGLLPNLRVLNMVDMCLDEMMLQGICSLNGLQSLRLQNCIAVRGIEPDVICTLRPPRSLEHFYYQGKAFPPGSLYLKILRQIIDPTHLKTFHSASWNATATIFKNFTGHSSLIELSLCSAVHDQVLQKVLTQCPRLKSLTIDKIFPSVPSAPPIPLPTSCIPGLQSLACPPSMLSDLVPGRPLQKLIISGISLVDDPDSSGRLPALLLSGPASMKILAQSSTRIRNLRVPLQIFVAGSGAAACHFSSLERLHLDFYHENYDPQHMTTTCKKDIEVSIRNMCQETLSIPSLRTLTVSLGSLAPASWPFLVDLVLQHYLITAFLTKMFPNVATITFLTLVQWNKTTIKPKVTKARGLCHIGEDMGTGANQTGTWSAEVLPEHRRVLSALGTAGCLKEVYDYGGALRAAFGTALETWEYEA